MSQTTSPGVPMTADSTDRDEGCVFCPIPPQAKILREWGQIVAFEPLNPVTPGHVLVVPRWHATDIGDNIYLSGNVMRCAAELAADLGACNVITSKGAAATQTVPHLHVHVVPRHEGDGLPLPWTPQQAHLHATGPARDEGLRARMEALCDEARDGGGHDAVVVSVASIRAALAASPAPSGDTAPREDGLREALAALCRTGVFDVSEWGERGTPYSNGAAKAFAKVAALAARPVPPGPAATEERDPADYGYRPGDGHTSPEATFCRTCGHLAIHHAAGRFSIYGICPPGPAATRDGEAGDRG